MSQHLLQKNDIKSDSSDYCDSNGVRQENSGNSALTSFFDLISRYAQSNNIFDAKDQTTQGIVKSFDACG